MKHISENPVSAALVRVCAVWLVKADRLTSSDEMFWAQALQVKQSFLHKKIIECIKMGTQLGKKQVKDQLQIDIYNELFKLPPESIKIIFNGARNEK